MDVLFQMTMVSVMLLIVVIVILLQNVVDVLLQMVVVILLQQIVDMLLQIVDVLLFEQKITMMIQLPIAKISMMMMMMMIWLLIVMQLLNMTILVSVASHHRVQSLLLLVEVVVVHINVALNRRLSSLNIPSCNRYTPHTKTILNVKDNGAVIDCNADSVPWVLHEVIAQHVQQDPSSCCAIYFTRLVPILY